MRIATGRLSLLLWSGLGVSMVTALPPPGGVVNPILHYRLEGTLGIPVTTVVDDANGNNGTAVGDPFFAADDPGCGDTAVDFSNDGIAFGPIPQLATLEGDLTLEILFNARTVTDDTYIVANWPVGSGFQFVCATEAAGTLVCSFSDGVPGHNDLVRTPDALETNRWYHVAWIRDTSLGEVRLYVDTWLVEAKPIQRALSSNNSAFSIGARHNDTLHFDGLIAEVRITDAVVDPSDFLIVGSCSEPIPGDCDNNGIVDLTDFAGFALAAHGPGCAGSGNCQCYDINDDQCVDLLDFAALQVAFGSAQDASGPPPSNIFVLQLADYHEHCGTADGGDSTCHIGDPCCQTQTGQSETPCDVLQELWTQVCDTNGDGERDLSANLDTLAEWNDFFWEPGDACNLLAREQYPHSPTDGPYTRHFIPMCTDGTTPPKGTTVCPDGQPIVQCTDGTRPVFYYLPGTTDRWIIKIQSGGHTCSENCWADENRSHYSSAWADSHLSRSFGGLYKPSTDWPFASYNRVIIDKCVGDRNCGSKTLPLQDFFADDGTPKGQGPVYFHGYREMQALLAYLTFWDEDNTLTPSSQIAIATHSAGSKGLYSYIDRLADFIRHDPSDGQPGLGLAGADIRGLASGFVPASVEAENLVNHPSQTIFDWSDYRTLAFDDHITAPFSTVEPDAANGQWYSSLVFYDGKEFELARDWGTVLFETTEVPTSVDEIVGVATLDESCFREHGLHGGGGDNVEACLDAMHVLMNHVTTPVFLAPQLHDFIIRRINTHSRMTNSFFDLGYIPDDGSLCDSHDENFACAEQPDCPPGAVPCSTQRADTIRYDAIDFAIRVRAIARGAVNRSSGVPEESPSDVQSPVGHAVFAPEWRAHDSWADAAKMGYQICDEAGSGECAWRSAPLWAALKSWLELDATVICVEQDDSETNPNRPLTSWSETTPGPLLDERCGLPLG